MSSPTAFDAFKGVLDTYAAERQVKDAEIVQYLQGGPLSTSIIYGRNAG